MDPKLEAIFEAVLDGNMKGTGALVQKAVDAGLDASLILQKGLIAAMSKVGALFEEGEYFVPEMLVAARAMKAGLAILQPLLVDAHVEPVGQVVIGTVSGDMHDIGKNLVGMMLEGVGFKIIDLGTDVSPDQFIEAIQANGAQIVGMSALLTTTMPAMERTIQAIAAAGVREQVKIIVGGAPVTAGYAQQIGADGFAADASQAATLAKSLVE